MAPKLPFDSTILSRGIATGARLGRGTADRLVGVAGPRLGRLTDRVTSRLRSPEPPTTTTFVPSARPVAKPVAEPTAEAPPEHPATTEPAVPSPASIARNVAPERPSAKAPRAPKPKSAPGAKLPPRRPSTA